MPTVTETPQALYAHCVDPRCRGYEQRQVDGLRRETAFTYAERGGNAPGFETSFVDLLFAGEESDCPHCGRSLELSESPRKQYAALSGHDPNGLLSVGRFDPAKQQEIRQAPPTDSERQAMEAEMAALREQLADAQSKLEPAGAE